MLFEGYPRDQMAKQQRGTVVGDGPHGADLFREAVDCAGRCGPPDQHRTDQQVNQDATVHLAPVDLGTGQERKTFGAGRDRAIWLWSG